MQTEWGSYSSAVSYTDDGAESKEALVGALLEKSGPPKAVWDLGANDGRYSYLALGAGAAHVVAFDIDPVAVQRNFNAARAEKLLMLPLLLDLSNPSPAIGFGNAERKTIGQRQRPGLVMMLAVIHHLAISNNLPFSMIAQWLASLSPRLIIEFVPKSDAQVQLLLATREDIFPDYDAEHFEAAFGEYYTLAEKRPIADSDRILYLFEVKK